MFRQRETDAHVDYGRGQAEISPAAGFRKSRKQLCEKEVKT